jgi:hypothetical protein
MFEQAIETTIGHLGSLVIGDAHGVTRNEIAHSSLPAGIKKMFDLDVERWVKEEQVRILASPHFHFDSELDSMIRDLSVNFRDSAYFTREEFLAGLDRAVKLHFNYVCRPQWTMRQFIFADCENASADSILAALETFTEYEYYRIILREYFEKKAITTLHARKFEDLVSSIDKELCRNLDTRKLAQLMQPVFEFFALGDGENASIDAGERTIPIEAAILFYDDKDLATVVETLERCKEQRGDATMHDLIMLLGEADIALSLDISTLISRHVDGHRAETEVSASAAREYEIPEFDAFSASDSQEVFGDHFLDTEVDEASVSLGDDLEETELPGSVILTDTALDFSDAPDAKEGYFADHSTSSQFNALDAVLPDEFESVLGEDELVDDAMTDLTIGFSDASVSPPSPYSLEEDLVQDAVYSSESVSNDSPEETRLDTFDILPSRVVSGEIVGDEISLDNIILSDQTSVLPDHQGAGYDSGFATGDSETTSLVMSLDDLIAGVPIEKETYKEDILAALELDSLDDDVSPVATGASPPVHDKVARVGGSERPFLRNEASAEDSSASAEIIARYGDLHSLINAADRKRYVRKLFGRDEAVYERAITLLNGKASWREASECIDELFVRHEVDLYSRLAVKFTDDVYKRYMTKKV